MQNRINANGCLRVVPLLLILNLMEVICLFIGYFMLDLRAQYSVASRLGIERGWDNFEIYASSHLQSNVSRKTLLDEAERIGSFTLEMLNTKTNYCEILRFKVGPFGTIKGGRWTICYDENYFVLDVYRSEPFQ